MINRGFTVAMLALAAALPACAEKAPELQPVALHGVAEEMHEVIDRQNAAAEETAPAKEEQAEEDNAPLAAEPYEVITDSPTPPDPAPQDSNRAGIFIPQTDEMEPKTDAERKLLSDDAEAEKKPNRELFLRPEDAVRDADTAAKVTYQREVEAARQAEAERQAAQQQQQQQLQQQLQNILSQGGSVSTGTTPPY